MSKSERWTWNYTDYDFLPVGSGALKKQAVKRLGPFTYRTIAEAALHAWTTGRTRISEELALESVEQLARDFIRVNSLQVGAPRLKQVVEYLGGLEARAAELSEFLRSADDFTREYLFNAGTGVALHRFYLSSQQMDAARIDDLPPSEDEDDGDWVRALRALSQYAGRTRDNLLEAKGVLPSDSPDKGGQTNLLKQLYGHPRWRLAHDGWHIYDTFKPDEAVGTEGGLFHLFLMDVFAYATGLDPEEDSKLEPYVKAVCGKNREMKALRSRENALKTELALLSPASANGPREMEILSELCEIGADIEALWPKIYPYR